MFGLYVCKIQGGLCEELSNAISPLWYTDHMFWAEIAAAVVTAAVGGSAIYYARKNYLSLEAQTKQLKDQIKSEARRKREEAIAGLSHRASVLVDYTKGVLSFYNAEFLASPNLSGQKLIPNDNAKPELPLSVLAELQGVVGAFIDEANLKSALMEIQTLAQAVNSRIYGQSISQVSKYPIGLKRDDDLNHIIFVLRLYVLSVRLLAFGRDYEAGFNDKDLAKEDYLDDFWLDATGFPELENSFLSVYEFSNDEWVRSKERSYLRRLLRWFFEEHSDEEGVALDMPIPNVGGSTFVQDMDKIYICLEYVGCSLFLEIGVYEDCVTGGPDNFICIHQIVISGHQNVEKLPDICWGLLTKLARRYRYAIKIDAATECLGEWGDYDGCLYWDYNWFSLDGKEHFYIPLVEAA